MASRPVRSTDRLIDAPTIPLPRTAIELGRQAWALLQRDGQSATFDQTATELGVDRATAVTATAQHVRATVEQRTTDRARQAYEALTGPGATFSNLAPIARRFGITATELVDLAIEYAETHPDAGVSAGSVPACPAWCVSDHSLDYRAADGWDQGVVHERVLTELPAGDPAYIDTPATATVLVECTETAGVVTPPRLVVTIAEGDQGHYAGSDGVQGWTGSPEQAEQLAGWLLTAARTVRGAEAPAYRVDVFTADDVLMTSRTVSAVDDQAAEHAARRLVDELGGAAMAAVFTASLVYVGTVTR